MAEDPKDADVTTEEEAAVDEPVASTDEEATETAETAETAEEAPEAEAEAPAGDGAAGAEAAEEEKDAATKAAEAEDAALSATETLEAKARAERKAKADAVIAERTVTRRTVTSRRVTPKAGAKTDTPADAPEVRSKARDAKITEAATHRYEPPAAQVYEKGPSPWWVPALMFGLLIVGALIIMLNYMGAFGDADNIRLVIGLAFILGAIISATQYR